MALFVVFVYLKPWFTARSIASAATNDLNLFNDLLAFKRVSKVVSKEGVKTLQRHTWYLTEESIAFSLFDEDLPLAVRSAIADAIVNQDKKMPLKVTKPTLPKLKEGALLVDYVGPRSCLLFNLLGISTEFLGEANWYLTKPYHEAKVALKRLSSTNDSAERAIALLSTYNTRITQDEESFQELLQVVDEHRKLHKLNTKNDLMEFY